MYGNYLRQLKVGDKIEGVFDTNPSNDLFKDVWLPMVVLYEYEKFYTCEVLPHRNPRHSWGLSKPYIMTIEKFDLLKGFVRCRPLNK